MKHEFTLEYWQDDDWFVGRLKEMPGVFSQGETLEELERNIEDAYQIVAGNSGAAPRGARGVAGCGVKRRDFIRELVDQGCSLARHGSRHDLYVNPTNVTQATRTTTF